MGNVWKSCVTPKNTVKNVEKAFLLAKLQLSLDFPIWSLFVPLCDQNRPMLEKCSLKLEFASHRGLVSVLSYDRDHD